MPDDGAAVHGVSLPTALNRIGEILADHPEVEVLEGTEEDFGDYKGLPPKIELLDDGRLARLLEAMSYHRPDGTDWPVPVGSVLDGASIPRVLWTLIGGPFEGRYRNASIVHDSFCDTHERRWQDTHRMFYDAMRCSGVGAAKAGVMFYAVYRFGPRWDDATLEAAIGGTGAEILSDSSAQTLLRDAQAIVEHGLNVSEITALADARDLAATRSTLESIEEPVTPGAELLVVAGGNGSPEDVEVVASHARALPDYVVARFFEKNVRIVACRENVTDFERDLDGVIPRGWERTGRTWNSVPGAYFPNHQRVVVATVAHHVSGRRVIPDKQTGLHGSDDLLVHESLHGYDYSLDHAPLREPSFRDARDADRAGLTDYENQGGAAGLEETFAETGAQHCIDPRALTNRCPRLAGYWQAMPIMTEGLAPALEAHPGFAPLGLAVREADGRILLDLRATDDEGAIGHASIELAPNDPHHATLDQELFPDDGLESMVDESGRRTAPFFG